MTTLIFTGDIAFSQHLRDAWRGEIADEAVREFLRGADHVVANVEGPITARPFLSEAGLNHASAPESAEVLRELGLDVWNLCNNHLLDCGEAGVRDSLAAARSCGCRALGVREDDREFPAPLVLGEDGSRVGLFSIIEAWSDVAGENRLATLDRTKALRGQIRALRRRCDYVVAVVHAGREYCSLPLPPERSAYHRLLKLGADVVVAHHPHVAQSFERVGGKLIFYSLGNFLFDTPTQRQFRRTDAGILLKLRFSPEGIRWTYLPTRIDRARGCVRAAAPEGTGAPAIFREFALRDYLALWPLAAAVYRENCVKKNALFSEGTAPPAKSRALEKLRALGNRDRRVVFLGRVLARSGIHRLSKQREAIDYLIASLPERTGKDVK